VKGKKYDDVGLAIENWGQIEGGGGANKKKGPSATEVNRGLQHFYLRTIGIEG